MPSWIVDPFKQGEDITGTWTMNRAERFLLWLVISFLFTCCSVQSDRPLSAPRDTERDLRLEGLWSVKDEKQTRYFYVAYGQGAYGSILAFGKEKDGLDAESFDFFVTRTPNRNYLNVIDRGNIKARDARQQTKQMYLFAEYHFSWASSLVLSQFKSQPFEQAIKNGILHGKLEALGGVTILQTPSERILSFVETSKQDEIFLKVCVATKIRGP
jgi:hypothetical protein